MSHTPRLRMFAGPNGSGKSTLKDALPEQWLGVYVNADEIEKKLRTGSGLDFNAFSVHADLAGLQAFCDASTLLQQAGMPVLSAQLCLDGQLLTCPQAIINSYLASVLSDYIRHLLLEARLSFSFETVMSSSDKVEFLRKAHACGYRTYLYFVATEDPQINLARVAARVKLGGHPVPPDKIISRYQRCLDLLLSAVEVCDRGYFFDNSGNERTWIAESNGEELILHSPQVPDWFVQALWDKV